MAPKKKNVLDLTGSLSIQKVESLHAELLEKSEAEADLRINCAGLTDIDFAALQLLYSLFKTYRDKGGKLELVDVSPKVRECFELSDFESLIEGK